ncbi:MAG TPA: hypothetical protein VFD02_02965 [Syntrophomonadaceae bacterium]|nr:hypothetical protein [Syntrophomonadaceae bacterium]
MREYLSLLMGIAIIFILINPNIVSANNGADRPNEDPQIIIARDSWMPEYKAGETVNLSIPVENVTSTSATNVRVSITPGDPERFPFEMDKMTMTKYAYSLSGRSLFSYKVKIPSNTKAGVYPINVNLTYETDYGLTGSESATVYVKIINEHKQSQLKLMGIDFVGDKLSAGKSALIKLRMQNTGDLDLKNIELKLGGFSSQGFNLDNWPDTQYIKTIKGQEIKLVEYRLLLDSKLESGTHALDLNMKYEDEADKEYTGETKIYLPVDGKGSTDDLTPRVIIDNYYIPSDYIEAGQTFALTISFFNTSETTTVKNIKVSINSDEQIFTPVASSNSFYIKEIKAGEFKEKVLNLKAKIDAENRNYTISADIEFQDEEGEKYTEKEIISIPVNQELNLTISNIEIPPQVFAGSPSSLSVDFYNTGRTLIRNLIIETEGNFDTQDGSLFIGNLEPGKDNYYDVMIIPHEEGSVEGKIIFTYEDEIGEKFVREQDFSLEVMAYEEPPMMDHEMGIYPEGGKSEGKKRYIIGGIALLVVGSLAFLVIRRRRRKKQEEVFLDE